MTNPLPRFHTPDEWYEYCESNPEFKALITEAAGHIAVAIQRDGVTAVIKMSDVPGGRVGWFLMGATWALLAGEPK